MHDFSINLNEFSYFHIMLSYSDLYCEYKMSDENREFQLVFIYYIFCTQILRYTLINKLSIQHIELTTLMNDNLIL